MIDIAKLKVGDRVHYLPFEGCPPEKIENGRVKEIPDHTNSSVRVVFNCGGEWNNFMDYTSQLTPLSRLRMGWHTASLYSLDCDYYKKSFATLEELIDDIVSSGMDPNYEITLNGNPTGDIAFHHIMP
jgi:hypothetical protein